MTGEFLAKRMMFIKSRMLNTLKMRFETKYYLKDVKKIEDILKKYDENVAKHDLSRIQEMNEDSKKYGEDMAQEWGKLLEEDLLFLDYLSFLLPDIKAQVRGLDKLAEKVKSDKDIYRVVLKNRKEFIDLRKDLVDSAMKELEKDYKLFLNAIAQAGKDKRALFMTDIINLVKTGGEGYINYMAIRMEVKNEIKEIFRVKKLRGELMKEMKNLVLIIDGKKVVLKDDLDKMLARMADLNKQVYEQTKGAFMNGTKAIFRSFIALFSVMAHLDRLYYDEIKLANSHDIPRAMAEQEQKIIDDIFARIDKVSREMVEGIHFVEADLRRLAA